MTKTAVALAFALLGCGSDAAAVSSAAPAAPSGRTSASAAPIASSPPVAAPGKVTLDGVSVGSSVASLFAREAFRAPCGDSSINSDTRRLISYMAKPCDGRSLPEKTTVIVFAPRKQGPDKDAEPIEAIVWLGGSYFESRSQFPAKMGMSVTALEAALGPGRLLRANIEDGNLGRHGVRTNEGVTLTARKHRDDVHSLTERDVAIGFVLGTMPDDPDDERWRMIAQLYNKFTRNL